MLNAAAQSALVDAGRQAAITAAQAAWIEAGMLGLCVEGRWDYVIDSMQQLDSAEIARTLAADDTDTDASRGG